MGKYESIKELLDSLIKFIKYDLIKPKGNEYETLPLSNLGTFLKVLNLKIYFFRTKKIQAAPIFCIVFFEW